MTVPVDTSHSSIPKPVCDKLQNGFTLVELLVVIAVIGILMAMLLSAISEAKERALITVTNVELAQAGLAIQMYYDDNGKFPPTQEDCSLGILTGHLYQLPRALTKGNYLPSKGRNVAMSTILEDHFNRGHTYKYKGVGDIIVDRDIIDKWDKAKLWVPTNFPANSSIDPNQGQWYDDPKTSPVSWVVFSLGPRYSEKWHVEKLGEDGYARYPVPKELWYTPKERRGFIVRMRLKNGAEIGSFERGL